MKNLIFSALMLISINLTASTEKPVKSSVNKVTVFTQGAQVFRSAPVTLAAGSTNIVFSGLSQYINPATIQASGKGGFVILDVKHRIKYPEPPAEEETKIPAAIQKEITQLEDSLQNLNFTKDELSDRLNALMIEKEMITKNKLTKGEGKSDSLEVLIKAMDFFHKKFNELNTLIGKTKRDQTKNIRQISLVNARLGELRTYKSSTQPARRYDPEQQVIVSVSADAAVTGTVEISYMVSQAGWVPSYDLRAISSTAPVQITYKAGVFQNTGELWDDVRLKLSTSNPNRSNIKPALPPWYITYYTAVREMPYSGARPQSTDNVKSISRAEEGALDKQMQELSPAQSAAHYSQLVETMTNVEFDIKLRYTIPSDGGSHLVSVKTDELPATYMHYLVPKMDSEAFLLARITGWENLSLLPGSANVFYDGTYVGQTMLNPMVINDTLDLSLGRDNGITVTRTRLPVKEGSKIIGDDITKTITYEIRMKNNKSKAVKLLVEDQVPLSNNKEIRVEVKDTGKADLNNATGLLKWDVALEPKSYKELKFTYEVTHNKGRPLSMY